MLEKAVINRKENIIDIDNWADFMNAINERKQVMAPWCNEQRCEIDAKERSKNDSMAALEESKEAGNEEESLLTGSAKTLCIPNE
jgi:prolyl-tRNA synthetase